MQAPGWTAEQWNAWWRQLLLEYQKSQAGMLNQQEIEVLHKNLEYYRVHILPLQQTSSTAVPAVVDDRPPHQAGWGIYEVAYYRSPIYWRTEFQKAMADIQHASIRAEKRERANYHYFPPAEIIFTAFEWCPLSIVKVVIIGQDPYARMSRSTRRPQAQGACFSLARDDDLTASLKNIFRRIAETVPNFRYPSHGCLENWGRQGILLLNKALTVEMNLEGSHAKEHIWNGFLTRILNAVQTQNPNTVFILWGAEAKDVKTVMRYIYRASMIVKGPHPVAHGDIFHKGEDGNNGDYFNMVNKLLKDTNQTEIDWNLDE